MPGGNRACHAGRFLVEFLLVFTVVGLWEAADSHHSEMLVGANSSTHPSKQTVMAKVKPRLHTRVYRSLSPFI